MNPNKTSLRQEYEQHEQYPVNYYILVNCETVNRVL